MVDKWPWWTQVLFGTLVTLAGVEGLVEDEQAWAKLLFLLVVASGLFNIAYGMRRRGR